MRQKGIERRNVPKIYVIHCTDKGKLPSLTPEQSAALKKGIDDRLAKHPGMQYNGTMFDPDTGIGVCDWDAADPMDVEEILNELGAPYDAVVPVQRLKL